MPPLTAQQISSVAVALLARTLVLPMTATRIPGGEFAGSNGDTITVRVRTPRSANKQDVPGADVSGLFTRIAEVPVDVQVAHLFDGVNVTDEDLSLGIEDFASQVTAPQVSAVAIGAEDEMAAAMNALAATASFALDPSVDDTRGVILAAREALGRAEVPMGDRWFAVSPEIATRVLSVPDFVRPDATGADSAIREAIIGRLLGFTFVESAGLAAGTAVAYHRSGFAFANRTPVTPRGASDSATATEGGVGLRHILQYNPNNLSDQSVVSTFAGASAVPDDEAATIFSRLVKMDTSTTA